MRDLSTIFIVEFHGKFVPHQLDAEKHIKKTLTDLMINWSEWK